MGRHDKLATMTRQLVHLVQQRQLPRWRKGRLGLIEKIQAVIPRTILDESEERLPMAHLMERDLSTCGGVRVHHARESRPHAAAIGLRRDVVEALRPQEEGATRRQASSPHADALVEDGMGILRDERVVGGASLGIEAICDHHGLKKGRLTRPVLTDEKCNVRIKCERALPQRCKRRNTTKVCVSLDELPQN